MIKSMTAFSKACFRSRQVSFTLTLRSLNHRYLKIDLHVPEFLKDPFEAWVRPATAHLSRGTISLTLSFDSPPPSEYSLHPENLRRLLHLFRQVQRQAPDLGTLSFDTLLKAPDVLRVSPPSASPALLQACEKTFRRALRQWDRERQREGQAMNRILQKHLQNLLTQAEIIQASSHHQKPQETAYTRLQEKIQRMLSQEKITSLDPVRLAQEAALLAQRLDFSEEIKRFLIHSQYMKQLLRDSHNPEPLGKKLDFLIQEMHRELTTLFTKAQDAGLSQQGVEMKTELERMRQMIQNIE